MVSRGQAAEILEGDPVARGLVATVYEAHQDHPRIRRLGDHPAWPHLSTPGAVRACYANIRGPASESCSGAGCSDGSHGDKNGLQGTRLGSR